MITFTDADLKRLKEYLTSPNAQTTWYAPADRDNLEALVARLEAAEAVCQQVEIWITEETPKMFHTKDLLNAWLSSSGKKGGDAK